MIAERAAQIRERLASFIYGDDETTLEDAVVRLLTTKRLTVATAESCTGGLLASRITSVPGSSVVFPGGVVSYSNDAKTDLVHVPSDMIREHGAVSRQVAESLAIGARKRFGSDFGVGITGVAGPDGGTPQKPVGLVYVGVAGELGVEVEENRFLGSRKDVRYRSAQLALVMLRNQAIRHSTAHATDG